MALYPGFFPGATTFPGVVYPTNDPTWWIGPLGRLRRLPCPERDIDMTQVRYGGVHQGISGARTVDTTGLRHDYKFDFTYLEPDEFLWLDLLYTRVVPGPLYLLNPMKNNRLSVRAVKGQDMDPVGSTRGGASSTANWDRVADYPVGLGFPAAVFELDSYPESFGFVIFDRGQPFPILPGETFSMSIWVRSTSGPMDVGFRVDWYKQDGTSDVAQGTPNFTIGTEWEQLTWTGTSVPAGYVGATMGVQIDGAFDAGNQFRWAAPQVNGGPEVLPFDTGGAAAQVVIDQLTSTTPRFPLRDGTLTVLEV